MQNNLQHVSRRMQRSIDRSEDVYVEYPVCVISVSVLVAIAKRMLISFSLCCALQQKEYIIISVNCNTEFWSLSSDYLCVAEDPVTHSNA